MRLLSLLYNGNLVERNKYNIILKVQDRKNINVNTCIGTTHQWESWASTFVLCRCGYNSYLFSSSVCGYFQHGECVSCHLVQIEILGFLV